jgi:hypothetical protein
MLRTISGARAVAHPADRAQQGSKYSSACHAAGQTGALGGVGFLKYFEGEWLKTIPPATLVGPGRSDQTINTNMSQQYCDRSNTIVIVPITGELYRYHGVRCVGRVQVQQELKEVKMWVNGRDFIALMVPSCLLKHAW